MIKKLSDRLIKQIAAGEVISKPYNAVKELIENSIDSGASNIQIYFQEYAMKSIIILDNGSGIKKEELILVTQLHTTSKTTESDSMFGINNFGFRGEALASIDAISNLIIESNGYKIENQTITESIIKKGTKVTVKNLFQNVPARLKFIKNPQFEFKLIKELIKKLMIQHNQINWTVSLNEKYIWNLKEDTKEKRIKNLYKEEPLIEIAHNENSNIKAFILKNQANTAIIFVNKRSIKDKSITKYISSLYKEYTFIHENPGYILDITINPIFVDYNVHPAKEEIKFMNYTIIFELLHSIFAMDKLATKINNENIIFSDHSKQNIQQEQSKTNIYTSPILKKLNKYNSNFLRESDDLDIFLNKIEIKTSQITIKPLFKIIGQLKNAYILFENEQGLGIFDQHAAHERQIYEKLKNGLTQNASQKLLTPIKLKLSNEAQLFIEENINNLESKGIYIENTEIIYLPILFKNIIELVNLIQNLQPPCDINTEIDRLLANIACKNALKANTPLSIYQMQILLEVALINPPICNHGRPVFKYFSNNEIKNFFKRT